MKCLFVGFLLLFAAGCGADGEPVAPVASAAVMLPQGGNFAAAVPDPGRPSVGVSHQVAS